MIVFKISEITILGVLDRGVPNQERIALRIEHPVNLGQYGLMLGIRGGADGAFPIRDNLFWFGDGTVRAGDWILVYTGPGTPVASDIPSTTNRVISIHWGRNRTVFDAREVVPILFRVDAVAVHQEVLSLPAP